VHFEWSGIWGWRAGHVDVKACDGDGLTFCFDGEDVSVGLIGTREPCRDADVQPKAWRYHQQQEDDGTEAFHLSNKVMSVISSVRFK